MIKNVTDKFSLNLFRTFSIILLSSVFLSVYLSRYYLLLIPVGFVFLLLSFTDFPKIYFLLLCFIPLSMEYNLTEGFATDIPTEPLMVLLMFIYVYFILLQPQNIEKKFFNHPIIILLFLQLCWTIVTVIYSTDIFISLKYLLAKFWYVVVFVLLTSILLKDKKALATAFWCIFIPLFFVVVQTLIRHSITHFQFDTINPSVVPFFRNHVNYAATLSLFVPFIWAARNFYKKNSFLRYFLNFSILLFVLATYLSFTRTAWGALIVVFFFYFAIKNGLFKWIVVLGIAAMLAGIIYLGYNNTFMRFSPNYDETIVHHNLTDHMEATLEMQDVSSMERVFRWVAAARMSAAKPITGYGPNNFYKNYKCYSLSRFETYLSDNPEKSTVHNYGLLVLVEQGYVGLFIFLCLVLTILLMGEKIYRQCITSEDKYITMACLLSFIAILVNNFLSDLIETDKIGSFYFMIITLLVNQDIKNTVTQK